MSASKLVSFGIFIHVIFLISVFDVYFKTTVIIGVSPVNNSIPPVGKRVVVMSADGLRADSVFDKHSNEIKDAMPYLKSIMEERGTWGLSVSHVPTESRPGHVAMLAGFYEDPSAVTKGWKENPVTFDSVFNRSLCSFAWGSPDILGIFFKGLNRDCAHDYSYTNEQDFSGDTMEYDNWVYREVKTFLQDSRDKKILFESGIFFFLHLLGQDTSGHTHKPHTDKYLQNLKNVDRIVKEVEVLISEFYKDDLTSFVFTSDHGMTDWGSHGAGHPNETDTPIIAWGAGINRQGRDFEMVNVDQADITPLLAVLLGSAIPVNSVGVLPLQFLNMSDTLKSRAMLMNAKQIAAQFQTNLRKVEAQIISFFHSPFEKLTNEELELMTASISEQIKNKQYEDAIEKSRVLIQIGLEGLEYYQNYYQRLLLISISSSYILWILYLTLELYDKSKSSQPQTEAKSPKILFFAISQLITFSVIVIQKLPLSYTLYFFLPQFLLFLCLGKVKKGHFVMIKKNKMSIGSCILIMGLAVEIIVASFFYRALLCVTLISTVSWSLISSNLRNCEKGLIYGWFITGIILSGFCLLPVVGGEPNVNMITLSGFTVFVFLLVMFLFDWHRENVFTFSIRCLSVAGSAWNSAVVHSNFEEEGKLPRWNQLFSWGLSSFALIFLTLSKCSVTYRFDQVFISFLVPFILLSIRHEGFFILFLFLHLRCWVYFECNLLENEKPSKDYPCLTEFRRGYIFLLYVWVSFFGLGNLASLNSFDPAWVRCFLTVFSPFLMAFLILFKTIIPFLIVSCATRLLTVILKLRADQLFIIVLIYCNIMGLNFLYLIRNKGSWLDIGSSISHYVIQQTAVVFLLLLYGIAKFLLSFSFNIFPGNDSERFRSKDTFFSLPSYHSNHKFHRS